MIRDAKFSIRRRQIENVKESIMSELVDEVEVIVENVIEVEDEIIRSDTVTGNIKAGDAVNIRESKLVRRVAPILSDRDFIRFDSEPTLLIE